MIWRVCSENCPADQNSRRRFWQADGLHGMTISEVRGFGRQKGQTEAYRGAEYRVDFVPKVKIEIAIDDAKLTTVVAAILKTAHSGQIGYGKIFITNLEEVVRIRTSETGSEAL